MVETPTYDVNTIANLLLLTPRRVLQLARAGIVPRTSRGRWEIAPTVQGYIRYLSERALEGHDGDGSDPDPRQRLLKARAELTEMDAATRRNEYVAIDDVGAVVEAEYTPVRAALRAMPGRIAADLEGLAAPAIAETLTLKVEEILSALSAERLDG